MYVFLVEYEDSVFISHLCVAFICSHTHAGRTRPKKRYPALCRFALAQDIRVGPIYIVTDGLLCFA